MMPDTTNEQQTQTHQPILTTNAADNTGVHFISGLFWKKGKGLRSTEAVVLELAEGRLSMYDKDDRQVFSVPTSAVQAHFTRIGVLKLTIGGELYSLFMNSGLSTRLSPALMARLAQSSIGTSTFMMAAGSASLLAGIARSDATGNALPGALGGAAGAAVHGAAVHKDDKIMNQWRATFLQVAIPVTGKPQLLVTALIFGGLFFVILMATVLLSYLVSHR